MFVSIKAQWARIRKKIKLKEATIFASKAKINVLKFIFWTEHPEGACVRSAVLSLAFDVIVQPLIHILFISLFLTHCAKEIFTLRM